MGLLENIFSSQLTKEYVVDFLRGKGIAVKVDDDDWIEMHLYDYTWYIFTNGKQLKIMINFSQELENIDLISLSRACNHINDNVFAIKNYWSLIYERDAEGNITNEKPRGVNICFSLEQFCSTEKDFVETYEQSIFDMNNAIKGHVEAYKHYIEVSMAPSEEDNNGTIGFKSNSINGTDNEENNKEKNESCKKKKIGFQVE